MSTSPSPPSPSPCPRCGRAVPADAVLGACSHCLLAAGFASEPAAPTDATPPSIGELAPEFPQLDVLELLGRGGMGAVYKVRQRSLDRFAALKLLRPGLDADPTFAERFAGEARALAGLNHPGIVTLYEFGRTPGGLFFILMEFIDGVNLRQLLAAGRLAPREALAIIPPLCDALQYAHDRGLVHRDIKPKNILVDRLGRVKVADFGLAKLAVRPDAGAGLSSGAGDASVHDDISRNLTEAGKAIGTPRYMAPEQRERPNEVDHRADIYALGVVLYQMLTGEMPDARQLQPPSRRVLLDVRLDEIVLRALEKEPSRRYQHASAMKTQVEKVSSMGAVPEAGARGSPLLPTGRSVAGRPVAVAVVAALLVAWGLYLIAVGADFPNEFSPTLDVLAFPIGLGLWRFRPWWRYTALTFLAVMIAVHALKTGVVMTLLMHPMPAFITDNFDVAFNPMYFKDQPTVTVLFFAGEMGCRIVLATWMWRVLRRPGIKMLFASSRPWSRPWLEWTAFAGAQLLVFGGNILFKNEEQMQNAKHDVVLLKAELTGDATVVAQVKLTAAEGRLKTIMTRHSAGLVTKGEVETALLDVEVAKLELNAITRAESPTTTAPLSASSSESSKPSQPTSINLVVLGAVAHPKTYQLREGGTLLDALGTAGGWIATANLNQVSIVHRDSTDQRATTTYHDVNAILKGIAVNPGIAPGDSIFVPERLF